MIVLVGCFIAAIAAMAVGNGWAALFFFTIGMIAGWWSDRRDQQARQTLARRQQFMEEVRRHE